MEFISRVRHGINHLRKAAIFCLAFVMVFSGVFCIPAYASSSIPEPKEIDESLLTGDPRTDTVIIAASQIGYTENRSGGRQLTYFGGWASKNQKSTGAPWCSEFASWCVHKAGVPYDLYPKCVSVDAARRNQGALDRVFALEGGNKHSESWIGGYYIGTISLSDVLPGDIVLVKRKGTSASAPTHTAIVEEVDLEKKVIHTIDGNVGGSPTKVMRKKIKISHVYAVVKPLYELSCLSGVKAENLVDNTITVSWNIRKSITGYNIYRSDSADGTYEFLDRVSDSAANKYIDGDVEEGKEYFYKVVPYLITATGQTIDGFSYVEEAEEDGIITYVSAMAMKTSTSNSDRPPIEEYNSLTK